MSIPDAIHNMQLIQFTYDGYSRTAEPHTYGVDSRGNLTLCAYQVAGGSGSGETRGWKTFHVADMHALTVLEGKFASARPGYKRNDGAFVSITAQL